MKTKQQEMSIADKIGLHLGFILLAFVALTLAQRNIALNSSVLPSTTAVYAAASHSANIQISQEIVQ